MGYRSDVALRFNENVVEAVTLARKLDKALDEMLGYGKTTEPCSFRWEYSKWYDTYPDVQAIENLLLKLEEDDYGFIRVGEDTTDIEYRGSPCDLDMYVSRAIEW